MVLIKGEFGRSRHDQRTILGLLMSDPEKPFRKGGSSLTTSSVDSRPENTDEEL